MTLHSLAEFFNRLFKSRVDPLAFAARLERDALFSWLETSEQGLLDREAEDRVACLGGPEKTGHAVRVLRRDRRSILPSDLAGVFMVHVESGSPRWKEIDSGQLAPGDLIELREGDRVPVGVRLIDCDDFLVDQSALTGCCVPVRKHAGIGAEMTPADFPNIARSGARVASGRAFAVVVSDGPVRSMRESAAPMLSSLSGYGFLVARH